MRCKLNRMKWSKRDDRIKIFLKFIYIINCNIINAIEIHVSRTINDKVIIIKRVLQLIPKIRNFIVTVSEYIE